MKRALLCLISMSIGLTACGRGTAVSTTSNTSNASFGTYDISTSEPSSNAGIAGSESVQITANSPARNTESAGPNQIQKQNISLAQASSAEIDTAASDRKIIRNAELTLEADNPEDAQRKIIALAELKGGFVVESQQSSSEVTAIASDSVTLTVRVPAVRFSETLADIRNTSTRIVIESVKGLDVTEEYIDIEAQVRSKKALELQFMEIMKRADTVGDALNVQRQLSDVRTEIERIEGRKRFIENQSSMSTIKVRLQTAKVFAAASVGFTSRVSDAFTAGADVALNFVLGLVTVFVAVLPFALFVGLPAFLIVRYFWRRHLRQHSVVSLADDELRGT